MRVVVLAAGMSLRLGSLTKRRPKCLLSIDGDESLLGRILRLCAEAGLRSTNIVTGHGAQHVDEELQAIADRNWARTLSINTIFNARYTTANNCLSLLMGLTELHEPIVIINSDDIFDRNVLLGISEHGPTRLVIDNVKELTRESMKVYLEQDRICRIGKWLDTETSGGEYIGLAYIAGEDVPLLREKLGWVIGNDPQAFYEAAFDLMFKEIFVHPWYTNGLRWTEIDTQEDYQAAKRLVASGAL